MNLKFIWLNKMATEIIEIHSNPANKAYLKHFEQLIIQELEIMAVDLGTNRTVKVPISQIVLIETLSHISKLSLIDGKSYVIQKRLKELSYLEKENFYRINNSQIINLSQVQMFKLSDYARLEVTTTLDTHYMVSRHYAKKIKEKLTC